MESLEENHIKAVPKKIYNPEWEKLPIFKGNVFEAKQPPPGERALG